MNKHTPAQDIYIDENGEIFFRDYALEYYEQTPDYNQISFELWGY